MKTSRVVVTGMDAHTVFGGRLSAFWDALIAGNSGMKFSEGDKENQAQLKKQVVHCIKNALFDAGISETELKDRKTILVLGTFLGEIGCLKDFLGQPYPFDDIAKAVQLQLGINIPAIVLDNACSSGVQIIGLGMDFLRAGKADLAIVCAYEAIGKFVTAGMSSIRCLGKELRPFDAKRSGTMLGEGTGVLILESEDQAIARKAGILAEILGCGMSNDAYHYLRPHPEANGIVKALETALRDANLSPEDIDYINAHGTGTLLNDMTETKAIKTVFGKRAGSIPISSIKGSIGHTLGASGMLSAIATIMSIQREVLPMTANYQNFDPSCDLDYIGGQSRKQRIERALCNAFGFGGVNGVLALGRYPQPPKMMKYDENQGVHIVEGVSAGVTGINDEIHLLTEINGLIQEILGKLGPGKVFAGKMGIVMDVGDGLFPSQRKFLDEICNKNPRMINPAPFCYSFPNRISGEVAREFGITGPTLTICSSESNLQMATQIAQILIAGKKADRVLACKLGANGMIVLLIEDLENAAKTNLNLEVEFLMKEYPKHPSEVPNAV